MGAKLTAILLSLILLCGCTSREEFIPYAVQADGSRRYPGEEYTSHQVLNWCDGTSDTLTKGELYFYTGSLYAVSNYRTHLLSNGFEEVSSSNSDTLLDSLLSNGDERVRLLYQSTGTIRILLEKSDGVAHILLEGVERHDKG